MGNVPTIFYLDEQTDILNGKKFTAVSVAYIASSAVDEFRSTFYSWFAAFIREDGGSNAICQLPIIHGSDLLAERSDDEKLKASEMLLASFTKCGGRFRRVGYFDDSVPFATSRNERVSFCIANAFLRANDTPMNPSGWMIVSEIDLEGIRAGFQTIDRNISQYYQLSDRSSADYISINFNGLIGHFFALKTDLGCQVSDLSGYIAFKAAKEPVGFGGSLAKLYWKYEEFFDFNEIIEMKMCPPID